MAIGSLMGYCDISIQSAKNGIFALLQCRYSLAEK